MSLFELMLNISVATLLASSGLVPWWVAGRLSIPAQERVPAHDLTWAERVATLRRGANTFVSPWLR
ncbi:MAG: hypothetical protein ACK5MT_17725 [Actinomycetales bacterium]